MVAKKCTLLLQSFANNVVHMHLLKITLSIPTNYYNHYRYHLHNSIPTPLTLSLTYLLHRASIVSSQLLIVSPSLYISFPVPWGMIQCQLHKLQNYCLSTLLGSLERQHNLFMIMISRLQLNFGVNHGIFLALKPISPLYFTLRVIGKVNAPILHLQKSYICIFITNLYWYS